MQRNLPLLGSDKVLPEEFNKQSSEKYAQVIAGGSLDGGPPTDKEAKVP